MPPSDEFNAAASHLSNASSLSQVSTEIKLELYGLFKFVTISHIPNTPRPGILDFTGRAKWNAWQEAGKKYSAQSDPDGAAQARYLEIAKSLGWRPGVTADDVHKPDEEMEGNKGVITGTGVFVSTMGAPNEGNLDMSTIHGLAISGDARKLENMLEADTSLDINQKDEFGYTALHLACDRGNLEVVEVLARRGADRTLKDPDELTALELAETCGHEDIVNVLQGGQ